MAVLLGRQTAGTSGDFNGSGHAALWKFTATASGRLATIFAQTKVANATGTVTLAIYSDSAGVANARLAKATVSGTGTGTGVFSADVSASAVDIVNGTVYWLGWRNSAENMDFQGDASGFYDESLGTVDFNDPWTAASAGAVNAILWGESVDSAPASPPSWQAPLSGIRLPGQPAVSPPLGPASGSERSAFDVVTPLPISQFVHPLSLVLGARLFPSAQPYAQPSTGPITYDKTGSLLAGAVLSASDAFETSETGALLAGGITSAADAFTASETGALLAGAVESGADVFATAETGSLLAGSVLSGADVFTASETGSVLAGSVLAGADSFTTTETGSVLAGAVSSGADVFTAVETGSVLAGSIISGSATRAGTIKTGSLLAGSVLSGTDVASFSETGSLLAGGVQAGADAFTAVESGSLLGSSYLAGSAAKTTEGILTLAFGPPHPHGGSGQGSPEGGEGIGSPAGGVGVGDPSGSFYGKPSPRQVRT